MPATSNTQFAKLFDSMVNQHFQQMQDPLQGACRRKTLTNANSCQFPITGSFGMSLKSQLAMQPLNDPGNTFVTATIADYYLASGSDRGDVMKMPYDEVQDLAELIAGAVFRKSLQIKIDALTASGTSLAVTADIGGSNTNMNTAKLREAQRLMNKANIPADNRWVLMHANQYASLLSETQVTSSDFRAGPAPISTGKLPPLFGFNIVWVGDVSHETGLAMVDADDRRWVAWYGRSLGYVENVVERSSVEWSVERDANIAKGRLSAGAVAIEDDGTSTNGIANYGIVLGLADDDAAASA